MAIYSDSTLTGGIPVAPTVPLGTKIMTSEGEKIMTSTGYQLVTPALEKEYPSPVPTGTKIMTSGGEKIMTSDGYKLVTPELEKKYPSPVPTGTKIMTSGGEKIMTSAGYQPVILVDSIRNAESLSQAMDMAKSQGIQDTELGGILQGSYLEPAYKQQFPSGGTLSVPPSLITISLSDAERASIVAANAKASCPGEVRQIRTYKVGTMENGVWKDVYVEETSEEKAKKKAEDTGYDVKRVTWSPSYVEKPSAENIAINTYSVQFERGKPISVNATSESQAMAIVANQIVGLGKPLSATRTGQVTITSAEAETKIRAAYDNSQLSGVEALLVYGSVLTDKQIKNMFGQVIEIPEVGSVPVSIYEGIMLISGDDAISLRGTSYYKDATGDDAGRLGIAITSTQKEFNDWLNDLQNTSPYLYGIYQSGGIDAVSGAIDRANSIMDRIDSGINDLVKQRLEQQVTDYNGLMNKNLTLEQYLDKMATGATGITQKAKDILLVAKGKYKQDGGYNLPLIIYDKVATVDELKLCFQDTEAIDEANDYVTRIVNQIQEFDSAIVPRTVEGMSWPYWDNSVTGGEVQDIRNAMKETGLSLKYAVPWEGGDVAVAGAWAKMSGDEKYDLIGTYLGYPKAGAILPSAFRKMTIEPPEEYPALKITQRLVAGIPAAIMQPFFKDDMAGEGERVLAPYARFGEDGNLKDYNLTAYIAENPYDTGFLVRAGFKLDEVERAGTGEQVYTMPEGATAKDIAISALTVASLAGAGVAGALGGIGRAATVASGVSRAGPVAMGAIGLPETIGLVSDANIESWEKGFAIGIEALLFAPAIGPILQTVQGAICNLRPDFIPFRALNLVPETPRIHFTTEQVARIKGRGLTVDDMMNGGTLVVKDLAKGQKAAFLKLGDFEVKLNNTQYQRLVGGAYFHTTPDGSLIIRGYGSSPIIRDVYATFEAARDPMMQSYLGWVKGGKRAIIELRIDPDVAAKLFPQEKLISWKKGTAIEPEAMIPSSDRTAGMGYRIELLPGKASHGTTFEWGMGKADIWRCHVLKVTDNPTGLATVKLGGTGPGGVAGISDLHATTNHAVVFEAVNSRFSSPFIEGDPKNSSTWHIVKEQPKGRTFFVGGDLIDGGPLESYFKLAEAFDRLADEAKAQGCHLVQVAGNHEVAWVFDDAIKGVKYTDALRAKVKSFIRNRILKGYVTAAEVVEGSLKTHAGVSLGLFKEYKGKTAEFIARDLNARFLKAVKNGSYSDKIFAKGRMEWDNSLEGPRKSQGGIFWLRPQEAKLGQLNLGFRQIVGHNPGFEIREIWEPNFVEIDTGVKFGGKVSAYADTPYMRTVPAEILTEKLPGKMPDLTFRIKGKLAVGAMRDTVADVFLGWDGRIKAIERLKDNAVEIKKAIADLDRQIKERRAAGDSIGVKFLEKQKTELSSARVGDYLYGGLSFWHDMIMGRQKCVRIIENASPEHVPPYITPPVPIGGGGPYRVTPQMVNQGISQIKSIWEQISKLSDYDIQRLFGMSKNALLRYLNTKGITESNLVYKLNLAADIVDYAFERNIAGLLPQDEVAEGYTRRAQDAYDYINKYDLDYDASEPTRYGPYTGYNPASSYYEAYSQYGEYLPSQYAPKGEYVAPLRAITSYGQQQYPGELYPVPPYVPPPYVPPPYVPPPYVPPPYIPQEKRRQYIEITGGAKKGLLVPEGSIAFAMGKLKRKTGLKPQWYYIPPPWTQETPISLDYPPLGAKHAEETTPDKTIQMIGEPRAKVPKSVSIDLGVVDILIEDYGQKIKFTGHGEETKVGKSLNIPTRGMSIPATAPMRVVKFKKRNNGHRKVESKRERVVA